MTTLCYARPASRSTPLVLTFLSLESVSCYCAMLVLCSLDTVVACFTQRPRKGDGTGAPCVVQRAVKTLLSHHMFPLSIDSGSAVHSDVAAHYCARWGIVTCSMESIQQNRSAASGSRDTHHIARKSQVQKFKNVSRQRYSH